MRDRRRAEREAAVGSRDAENQVDREADTQMVEDPLASVGASLWVVIAQVAVVARCSVRLCKSKRGATPSEKSVFLSSPSEQRH